MPSEHIVELATPLICKMKEACRQLPPHVACSFLRSLANSWTTSSRMSGSPNCCLFCRHQNGDSIRHMMACPVIIDALKPFFPRDYDDWPIKQCTPQALCLDEADTATIQCRMVWHDVILHCFHTFKHASRHLCAEGLIRARIRAICRESHFVRRLLVKAKRGSDTSDITVIEDE